MNALVSSVPDRGDRPDPGRIRGPLLPRDGSWFRTGVCWDAGRTSNVPGTVDADFRFFRVTGILQPGPIAWNKKRDQARVATKIWESFGIVETKLAQLEQVWHHMVAGRKADNDEDETNGWG